MGGEHELLNTSRGTWAVIYKLYQQLQDLRDYGGLSEGGLEYFREAVQMPKFNEARALMKTHLGRELFSNLSDIEDIESAFMEGRRLKLILQCLLIVDFFETAACFKDWTRDAKVDHSWLFKPCESHEDLAWLRQRLEREPVERRSDYVRHAITYSFGEACARIDREMQSKPVLPHISSETWSVIRMLGRQIECLRLGGDLSEGRLEHFRTALAMRNFNEVVTLTKKPDRALFSDLKSIRRMELAAMEGYRVPLILQCLLILDFFESLPSFEGWSRNVELEHAWLFASCESLTDAASLLEHIGWALAGCSGYAEQAVTKSFSRALDDISNDPNHPPQWREMLAIYEAKRQWNDDPIDDILHKILRFGTEEIPSDVATLFLSATTEEFNYYPIHEHYEERVFNIKKLLKLGASLMTTTLDEIAVYKRYREKTKALPEWFSDGEESIACGERGASALNKILHLKWTSDFLKYVIGFTCCSLDADGKCKARYNKVNDKIPKLECLAAQVLPKSDLYRLSTALRDFASRHQSFYLDHLIAAPF